MGKRTRKDTKKAGERDKKSKKSKEEKREKKAKKREKKAKKKLKRKERALGEGAEGCRPMESQRHKERKQGELLKGSCPGRTRTPLTAWLAKKRSRRQIRWRIGAAAAAASDQDPEGSGATTRVPIRAVEGHSTKLTRMPTDKGSIIASIARTRPVHTSPLSATTGSDELTSSWIVDPTSGHLAKTSGAASSGIA